jgi:hypothetical protein
VTFGAAGGLQDNHDYMLDHGGEVVPSSRRNLGTSFNFERGGTHANVNRLRPNMTQHVDLVMPHLAHP